MLLALRNVESSAATGVSLSSQQKNRHHQVAQRYLERGQRQRAIAEFEKALALEPQDIRTRLRIAELHYREGEADRAVDAFIRCARHYEDLGAVNKALTVYEQVLELLPDRVELYVAMADLQIKTGSRDAAMGQYRIALRVLDELGDPSGKLDVIRCILNLEPDNIRERVQLAESFFTAGRNEEGIELYRQILDWLERETKGELGYDLKSFQHIAERYLYHQPNDAQIAKRLAINYVQLDLAARALPKLRLAYRETPHDLELLGVIAQAFDQLGQTQKSVAVYKEMARLFERAGLASEKDRCFREILRLNPTDRSVREKLGELGQSGDGKLIQFESGPKSTPTLGKTSPPKPPPLAPDPDSIFGPPPVPVLPISNRPTADAPTHQSSEVPLTQKDVMPRDTGEVDIGFEDEIEHTIVDPSFIPHDLLSALDKSPALKVISGVAASEDPECAKPTDQELQELDFYIKSGLLDDATAILKELTAKFGSQPELLERQRKLDENARK